jgi:hypothetical protein
LNWFLSNVEIFDVADSLKKQLAAKLLFELFDPDQDLSKSNFIVKNMKILTILVNYYAKATSELQKNLNVSCIWECRFKPHIAKQLTLRKL